MTANNDTELKPMNVGDEVTLLDCRWRIEGIHLGALGQESLIQLVSLTHKPGWTGQWEYHPMLFVPEPFVRMALNTRAASGQGNQEAVEKVLRRYREETCNVLNSYRLDLASMMVDGNRPLCAYHITGLEEKLADIDIALSTPSTPSISLPQLKAICERLKTRGNGIHNAAIDQVHEAAEKGRK